MPHVNDAPFRALIATAIDDLVAFFLVPTARGLGASSANHPAGRDVPVLAADAAVFLHVPFARKKDAA